MAELERFEAINTGGIRKDAYTVSSVDAAITELQATNLKLVEAMREMVNDYINFDDGHLTESIFERASALIGEVEGE